MAVPQVADRVEPEPLPAWLLLPPLGGFLLALYGTYWDDAWHTERGRDSFFIAPHLCVYGGLTLAGAGLGLWGLLVARRIGLLRALRHPPLLLGLLGATVTVAAAPIDNAWHAAFGRDAVIWSPPHMLGIVASLTLAAGVTMELGRSRDRLGRVTRWIAAAGVLAAAVLAVAEYDTDVPQFALVWYLPVLGLATAFALSCVQAVLRSAWAATTTAAVYTAFRVAIGALLALLGFGAPGLALMALAAPALDVGRERRWHPVVTGAAFAVVLYGAYVPYLNWLTDGIDLSLGDVAIGLPLTTLGVGLLLAGLRRVARTSASPPPRSTASFAGTLLLVMLAVAPAAQAHDPGQGKADGSASLTATSRGYQVRLALQPAPCEGLHPVELTARRAGRVLHAPLVPVGRCAFAGDIRLDQRGRWFLYGELRAPARRLETWLPVTVALGKHGQLRRQRPIYEPPARSGSVVKLVSGALLYALMALLLAAAARMMLGGGTFERVGTRAPASAP